MQVQDISVNFFWQIFQIVQMDISTAKNSIGHKPVACAYLHN